MASEAIFSSYQSTKTDGELKEGGRELVGFDLYGPSLLCSLLPVCPVQGLRYDISLRGYGEELDEKRRVGTGWDGDGDV